MMNKNEVLPLAHIIGGDIPGPLWAAGWEEGIKAQRDADLKRMQPLVEAIKALCEFHERAAEMIFNSEIAIRDIPLLLPRIKAALTQLGVEEP